MHKAHPRLKTLATLVLWFAAGGCAFVGPGRLKEKTNEIDADGDGVPELAGDCDDSNPLVRPGTRDDLEEPPDSPQPWEDPSWVEIPYDGIDNDCKDGDEIDIDGDLYPGVSRSEYAARAVASGLYATTDDVPWPQSVFEDEVDCVDTDPAIFPNASDPPYNGIDEDCQRDNDYDDDGDGQMRPEENPADVAAYAESVGITIDVNAPNAFGDCLDTDATVFAGNPEDIWYDGKDSNCNGDNDFDADGDGYRPDGFDSDYSLFLQQYHPDGSAPWIANSASGDCMDQPQTPFTIDPAEVYPGAPIDTPYDGVDGDCAGDTDYDADGDGYVVAGSETEVEAYIANWSVGNPPGWTPTLAALTDPGGDCNDDEPGIAPGNLEVLGDANDSDCDGDADGTPFAFSSLAWEKPSWPRVVRNDEHYLIVTDARWAVRRSATQNTQLPDAALNLFFSADSASPDFPAYQAEPLNARSWANTNPNQTDPRSAGLDVVAEGQVMFVGNTYFTESSSIYKMGFTQRTFDTAFNDYSDVKLANRINTYWGFDTDADLTFVSDENVAQPSAGWLFLTMCGGGGRLDPYAAADYGTETPPSMPPAVRQMVIRSPFETSPASQIVPISPDNLGGGTISLVDDLTDEVYNDADVCWAKVTKVDDNNFTTEMHVCDIDGCDMFTSSITSADGVAWTGDVDTTRATSPYDGRGIIEADVHDGLLITVETAGLVVEDLADGSAFTLFADEPVLSGDAMITDEGMLYAAVVVQGPLLNEIRLAYGPADDIASLTISTLPVQDSETLYQGTWACDTAVTGCETNPTGRVIDPLQVGLHADEQRVVLAMSGWMPSDYTPSNPIYTRDGVTEPGPQDAVGWVFLGPASAPAP